MPSFVADKATYKKPWRARVHGNGQTYHLGYFLTREEASLAEDQARLALGIAMTRAEATRKGREYRRLRGLS